MFGLSIGHWVIVLVLIILLFGTSRLRNIGGDLGAAIKSFKSGLKDEDKQTPAETPETPRAAITHTPQTPASQQAENSNTNTRV